jgi:hypothetical protein
MCNLTHSLQVLHEMIVGSLPNMNGGVLEFPPEVSVFCQRLILSLLDGNASTRVGAAAVVVNGFFRDIDWVEIEKRRETLQTPVWVHNRIIGVLPRSELPCR